MANWSGTYAITAGATGTSTGGNTSTTFNNTGATWPTGAQSLANFVLRILSGTGAGQERVITSNTATQCVVPTWTTTPDATSTYEIVLRLANGDHVTAALTLTTNVITEIADSATVYVDGLYIIALSASCTVRWNKSVTTLATLAGNNRTVTGKHGFWNYLNFSSLTVAPQVSYIRILDAAYTFTMTAVASTGDLSGIHHIWVENGTASFSLAATGGTASYFRSFLFRNATTPSLAGFAANRLTQLWERTWLENCTGGYIGWTLLAGKTQTVRDCVFLNSSQNSQANSAATQVDYFVDNFVDRSVASGYSPIIVGSSTAADAGTRRVSRNVFTGGRTFYSGAAGATSSYYSAFNDWIGNGCGTYKMNDPLAGAFSTMESDADYLAGLNSAASANVDTTAATTSTASPQQYTGLTTARTNPRSSPNKPLVMDGVTVSGVTGESATITFNCANGVTAGLGETTINVDSAGGGTTLNVASTTGFEIGEQVEVGFGTARSELCRVTAVGAGTLTTEAALTYTHTAAQADAVTKRLRLYALPVVRYGDVSGIYESVAPALPPASEWGLIWTGIQPTWNGVTHEFRQTGHSVVLDDLKPNTTYYFRAYGYDPLGRELAASAEGSFTTSASSEYTDPGVAHVRTGTTYQFGSATPNRTGTLDLPAVASVKVGVTFDGGSQTGTYDGSDRWTDPGVANVRLGVTYKANSLTVNRTGDVRVPTAAQTRIGLAFDTLDSLTGTYDGADRWTDVPVYNVLSGYPYKANSVTDNRTGTLVAGGGPVLNAILGLMLAGF